MWDQYAATSQASRASCLRTWMLFHEAAHASDPDPPPAFPLTPDGIRRVSALFKAGRYISFPNYMFRAKGAHLAESESGPTSWTTELTMAMKDAIRSVGRGVGVARQSQPLDTVAVAAKRLPDDPLLPAGPIAPTDFVVAGTFSYSVKWS